MSKGSRPRPFSVSQKEFANSFDAIFRKPDPRVIEDQKNEDEAFEQVLASNTCHCFNCNKDRKTEHGIPYTSTHMILCPTCGNKRCPHSTDHNLQCTNSNEPGQQGSRY